MSIEDSIKVMFLVGNGFDVATLSKFGTSGITTSYKNFYEYFCSKYPGNDNCIIKAMQKAKNHKEDNWSDLELRIEEFFAEDYSSKKEIEKLTADLLDIQYNFSAFLNENVNDEVIRKISDFAHNNQLAKNAFSSFLEDLSEEQFKSIIFPSLVDNYSLVDFNIINFNYTSLLDNYLLLDMDQFDPEPYLSSCNNFGLYLNPSKYENEYVNSKTGYFDPLVRIKAMIFHPHGYQTIPRSLVFGSERNTEESLKINARDGRKYFVKSLFAQCDEKYRGIIENTKLFIVYGCSVGSSDSWWWARIFEALKKDKDTELIIYNYGDDDSESVKKRFMENAFVESMEFEPEEDIEIIKNSLMGKIYVINFGPKTKKEITFLQWIEARK